MFNQKRSNDLLRLCLLALAFIIFTVSSATAQNAKVTERVTDQNGDPVVGAAVMIKGTKKGAGTDINGRYSIAVSVKATLEFSSLAWAKPYLTSGKIRASYGAIGDQSVSSGLYLATMGTSAGYTLNSTGTKYVYVNTPGVVRAGITCNQVLTLTTLWLVRGLITVAHQIHVMT